MTLVPRGTRSPESARRPSSASLALLVLIALIATACSGSVIPAAPTPTATPFVAPTPTPTPAIASGRAPITFGTKIDQATLAVTDPKTVFSRTVKDIAWSVTFDGPAGSTTLKITFALPIVVGFRDGPLLR
jgi:hypothetical protein